MLSLSVLRPRLARLHADHAPAKDVFYEATSTRRQALFDAIRSARDGRLDAMEQRVREAGSPSPALAHVLAGGRGYFARSDWAMLDMVALAACTDAPVQELSDAIAPGAVLYHCLRMLDDVLDGHDDYKGGSRTLYGEVRQASGDVSAVHANVLPAVLLVLQEGPTIPVEQRALLERTLSGMLHESFPAAPLDVEGYLQIASAKMGAYGRFLYAPAIARFGSSDRDAVDAFLLESFVWSQVANDLYDLDDDARRAQPNYWSLDRAESDVGSEAAEGLERWADRAARLPLAARPYGLARVVDLTNYLLRAIDARDQDRDHRASQAS
jgi:hypothetical protein